MTGLREQALSQLHNMGVLVAPPKRAMEEQVMPWLMGKVVGFLEEDMVINTGSE